LLVGGEDITYRLTFYYIFSRLKGLKGVIEGVDIREVVVSHVVLARLGKVRRARAPAESAAASRQRIISE
jgi:hypothetical protein